MSNKIIVLVGRSASGKDSLAKYLSENYGYKFVVSHTSRPPRPDESQNNPYKFINYNQFETMITNDEMIEFRTYETLVNGIPDKWLYGVSKDSIDLDNNNYIVILDIVGLKAFNKIYGDKVISFYVNVSDSKRTERALHRNGFDQTEWDRRLIDDEKVFAIDIVKSNVSFIVKNYVFKKCIEDIKYCIKEYECEHG